MLSKPWVLVTVGVLVGYMLSDRLATVPVVNKLPKL